MGGQEFVGRIGASLPNGWVIRAPTRRKDISECHVRGDDVRKLVKSLRKSAVPYQTLQAKTQTKAAAEAEKQAAALLRREDILGEFGKLCLQLGLVGEDRNAKLLYLALTSRLLEGPVSVVVKGPSSGGKSFLVETVLKASPPSAFYALSSMSEHALAYSQESLKHRMLVIAEADGLSGDFGSYLVRTLLSERRIRYETVEKTDNGLVSKLVEREGPTGLVVTTTRASLHPENETRMISLTVRDDPEQTKAVMRSLANHASHNGSASADVPTWHALQTWLELAGVHQVKIPFAQTLAELCNPSAVRLRRDFGVVLNLIAAHALLHQKHRKVVRGHVIAEIRDYTAIHTLVSKLLDEGAQLSVSKETRETVDAVKVMWKTTPVTIAQVAERLKLDKGAASRRVRVAIQEGYLVNQEDKRGKPARLELSNPLPEDTHVLPAPRALAQAWRWRGRGVSIPSKTAATVQPRRKRRKRQR